MKRLAIVGAGGCAREVAMTIRQIGADRSGFTIAGYVVTDATKVGRYDSVGETLGDFAWLDKNLSSIDALVMGIGDAVTRFRVAAEAQRRFPTMEWPTFIHPSAQVDTETVTIGEGVVVGANAIINVNVSIEPFVLVHYACTVSHETRVGRASVLNPACVLSGGVSIGEASVIGAGAVILQYRSVGSHAVVGAGAVVTQDVHDQGTVAGVPARSISRRDQD